MENKGNEKAVAPTRELVGIRSQMELEELLLKELLIELENEESGMWDDEALAWADEPDEAPTLEQRAAFEERLDIEVKRIQKQKRQIAQIQTPRRRKTPKIFRRLGAIAAVLAVIILASFCFPDSAIAAGFNHILSTVIADQGAEELRLEEKEGAGAEWSIQDFVGMYMPTWVPKGFRVVQVMTDRDKKRIYYTDDRSYDICYEITEKNYSVLVDDEDVDAETIYLHDSAGQVIHTEALVYVVWEQGDYLYSISGQVELYDKIMQMAERCSIVEME